MIGQTLSHYRIVDKLGEGGMGVVFLAEDAKLSRKVALKILPPALAESGARKKRFEREAKAIAALNHPNIVTVHSVEESAGIHFITMELVRGKTLRELLPAEGFSLTRFLELAIPLSDALAAAHQEGIAHLDLKPANVMVSDQGRVKVLDFGLAMAVRAFDSELPTLTKTEEGHFFGTPAYMSPEQAEGKRVDLRSDVFSLGIILYETLTGRHPFQGETPAAVVSSILKDTPVSLDAVKPEIPRELSKIVSRCLAKDPARRFQTAIDVRNELAQLEEELRRGGLAAPLPRTRKWLLGAAALAVSAMGLFLLFFGRASEDRVLRLVRPVQLTSAVGAEDRPSWSPDGQRVAYESDQSGNWDIWVVQPGGLEAVNLTASNEGDDRSPSWSPDGRQLAFLSERDGGRGLYLMSALGGSARKLATLEGLEGSAPAPLAGGVTPQWSGDGSEIAVFAGDSEGNFVNIVSVGSQQTRRVTLPRHEGNACLDLSWSPDGRRFAYVEAIAISAEVTRLWVAPASGGGPIAVTDGLTNDWNPTWSADGQRLFYISNRGGVAMDLWQQRLGRDGRPEGDPESVTAGLGIRSAAFSRDGTKLAYAQGRRLVSNVWRVPILESRRATWDDAEPMTNEVAFAECVDVSPDGKRLVISSDRSGNQDLWVLPSRGGEMTPLTTDPTPDWCPQWSPDGQEIVFYAYRSGNRDIWVMPAEGGPARQLTAHPAEDWAPIWSSDSRRIAFSSRRSGNRDVFIVDAGGGEPRQITTDPGSEVAHDWSPDGRWVIFFRGGALFRVPALGGELERLTEGPAASSRLSSDGKVLYFSTWNTSRSPNLWALALQSGKEYPVTDFRGRRGTTGWSLATDDYHLYYTWWENVGDIWVMDVVND